MMKLVKYRDAGMHTYTYFWVDDSGRCKSPFFNSEKEAWDWYEESNLRSVGKPQ